MECYQTSFKYFWNRTFKIDPNNTGRRFMIKFCHKFVVFIVKFKGAMKL